VASDAVIRMAGKSIALGDLKAGLLVRLELKDDRRTIAKAWAGPAPEKKEDD
jgi:hypothetical protein